MKKILLFTAIGAFAYFGAVAQDATGNSTYGQSHKKTIKAKKTKKAEKQYSTAISQRADRKAINTRHKTAVRTATQNDALTNEQQKDQIKQANAAHKTEMRTATMNKTTGKKK